MRTMEKRLQEVLPLAVFDHIRAKIERNLPAVAACLEGQEQYLAFQQRKDSPEKWEEYRGLWKSIKSHRYQMREFFIVLLGHRDSEEAEEVFELLLTAVRGTEA